MNTVRSADGTTIAFDQLGSGPAVILAGGAFSYRAFPKLRELAELLAGRLIVLNYDRRGRGDSGDTSPYAVQREIEDVQALLDAAGGNYPHWRADVFYPPRHPQRDWLRYYAEHFDTVEVNTTFYRLPQAAAGRSKHASEPGRSMSAEAFLPEQLTLPALRAAVQHCRGCPLFANATQAVFGEGRRSARVMLVGEQPGDQEDRAGAPFVGPAGQLLDRALEKAGIDRKETYVTNAVKHFKWKPRGPRRIHDKPSWSEQLACRPWLEAELAIIDPQVLVLLGATAAQTLLGRRFRVTRDRGRQPHSELAETVIATIHPSAILRSRDHDEMFRGLVDDLTLARR